MSRRRKLVVTAIAAVVLLFGAATLWQSGRPEDRYAHVLLLDPKSGDTLHRQILDGGYAVPALLSGGRVAVATLDSCPDGKGGSVTVFDATLERVLETRRLAPCAVARLSSGSLRELLGDPPGRPPVATSSATTQRFAGGKLVQDADGIVPLALNRLTAYDASGRVVWRRTSFGNPIGTADARDGRVAVAEQGEFTPGLD